MYTKQFDIWNEEKKVINQKDLGRDFYVLERELWWCGVGVNVGREQDGKGVNFERPVVILKKLSPDTFLIVPTTSKYKENKFYIKITNGEKFSYALVDQIKVIDKKRLSRKLATVNKEEFDILTKSINELLNCESLREEAFSEA